MESCLPCFIHFFPQQSVCLACDLFVSFYRSTQAISSCALHCTATSGRRITALTFVQPLRRAAESDTLVASSAKSLCFNHDLPPILRVCADLRLSYGWTMRPSKRQARGVFSIADLAGAALRPPEVDLAASSIATTASNRIGVCGGAPIGARAGPPAQGRRRRRRRR